MPDEIELTQEEKEKVAADKAAREKAISDALLEPFRAMSLMELKTLKKQLKIEMEERSDRVLLIEHVISEKPEEG